jgi:hypothetical protein
LNELKKNKRGRKKMETKTYTFKEKTEDYKKINFVVKSAKNGGREPAFAFLHVTDTNIFCANGQKSHYIQKIDTTIETGVYRIIKTKKEITLINTDEGHIYGITIDHLISQKENLTGYNVRDASHAMAIFAAHHDAEFYLDSTLLDGLELDANKSSKMFLGEGQAVVLFDLQNGFNALVMPIRGKNREHYLINKTA